MIYKTVPGIVLASVCGSHFLLSPKRNVCVNDTAVFYWKKLETGADENMLVDSARQFYEIDDLELLRLDIENMLNFFLSMNMIKEIDE